MLVDKYGRPLNSLRVSVTNRCNHRCIFCHMEGLAGYGSRGELTAGDWGFVARVARKLGIVEAKLTGGEPLIRRDIADIAGEFSRAGVKVSITTNGSLLDIHAKGLSEARVDHVNVSLHSLKQDVFGRITGGDLGKVLKGIEAALDVGLRVKLDFVLLTINRDEVFDILNFAAERGLDVNLIELIPLGMSWDEYVRLHEPISSLEQRLFAMATKVEVRDFQSRPVLHMSSGIRVTLIRGYCNPELCAKCTRIRMTPDGAIKTCLYRNDTVVDAREAILSRDEEALVRAFEKANALREPFFKLRGAARS